MPNMANGEIVRFDFVHVLADQTAINRIHARIDISTGITVTDQAVVDRVSSVLSTEFKGLMNVSATYWGAQMQKLSPPPVLDKVISVVGRGVGTITGTPLPTQVSGFLQLITGLAGRTNRGRMYPPFPSISDVDVDAHPKAGYVVQLNNLGTILVDGVTASPVPADWRINFGLWRGLPPYFTDYIDAVAIAEWATQRRRGDKGKANSPPF